MLHLIASKISCIYSVTIMCVHNVFNGFITKEKMCLINNNRPHRKYSIIQHVRAVDLHTIPPFHLEVSVMYNPGQSQSLKMLRNKKLIYKSGCKRTCRHCFPSQMAADLLKMCVYVDYAYNSPFTRPHTDVYSRHRESKKEKKRRKTSVMFTHRNECHNQRFYSMVKDEEWEVVLTQQLKFGSEGRGLN